MRYTIVFFSLCSGISLEWHCGIVFETHFSDLANILLASMYDLSATKSVAPQCDH